MNIRAYTLDFSDTVCHSNVLSDLPELWLHSTFERGVVYVHRDVDDEWDWILFDSVIVIHLCDALGFVHVVDIPLKVPVMS